MAVISSMAMSGSLRAAFVDAYLACNPAYSMRNFQSNYDIVSAPAGNFVEIASQGRAVCDYCHQQNTTESFDGGCRSCGAPAPRDNSPRLMYRGN